jgi:hypothetical protein
MTSISKIYWRAIKAGTREFAKIPDTVKDDVRTLAKTDLENGVIDEEQYAALLGENA